MWLVVFVCFICKAGIVLDMKKNDGSLKVTLCCQPFATPEKVHDIAMETYRNIKVRLPDLLRSMSLYLANRDAEAILFRPIKVGDAGLFDCSFFSILWWFLWDIFMVFVVVTNTHTNACHQETSVLWWSRLCENIAPPCHLSATVGHMVLHLVLRCVSVCYMAVSSVALCELCWNTCVCVCQLYVTVCVVCDSLW